MKIKVENKGVLSYTEQELATALWYFPIKHAFFLPVKNTEINNFTLMRLKEGEVVGEQQMGQVYHESRVGMWDSTLSMYNDLCKKYLITIIKENEFEIVVTRKV